ncbi:hypothetical protein J6590_029821 [Homalodisca vitripennis]|nr:hypothetical protein J6590_029821 [Homalodisca vitripennis]
MKTVQSLHRVFCKREVNGTVRKRFYSYITGEAVTLLARIHHLLSGTGGDMIRLSQVTSNYRAHGSQPIWRHYNNAIEPLDRTSNITRKNSYQS